MINVNVSTATRWGINAVILLSITMALYLGQAIFIPTVIALLLAAMLWPLATWMHQAGIPLLKLRRRPGFPWLGLAPARWRMGWGMATISVLTILIGIVCATTVSFSLGLSKMFVDLGSPTKQEHLYKDIRVRLIQLGVHTDDVYLAEKPEDSEVFKTVQKFFNPQSSSFQDLARGVLYYAGNMIWQAILVLFILLFLLLEGRMLSRRFVEIFGSHAQVQGKAVEALKEMAYQVRAYLVWRTIINFAMAALLGVLYQVLGLKLAWSWALLTAVLWYIPYLGPIAAGIPPIIDAFVNCSTPWWAVFILAFYIVWVIIEGYFVVPVVMGRSMEMNATTVMLACLFWERVWGATGLFLAMPLIAAVKAICTHVPEWKPWANLMSSHADDEPAPAASFDSRRDGDTQVAPLPPEGSAEQRMPTEELTENVARPARPPS